MSFLTRRECPGWQDWPVSVDREDSFGERHQGIEVRGLCAPLQWQTLILRDIARYSGQAGPSADKIATEVSEGQEKVVYTLVALANRGMNADSIGESLRLHQRTACQDSGRG